MSSVFLYFFNFFTASEFGGCPIKSTNTNKNNSIYYLTSNVAGVKGGGLVDVFDNTQKLLNFDLTHDTIDYNPELIEPNDFFILFNKSSKNLELFARYINPAEDNIDKVTLAYYLIDMEDGLDIIDDSAIVDFTIVSDLYFATGYNSGPNGPNKPMDIISTGENTGDWIVYFTDYDAESDSYVIKSLR